MLLLLRNSLFLNQFRFFLVIFLFYAFAKFTHSIFGTTILKIAHTSYWIITPNRSMLLYPIFYSPYLAIMDSPYLTIMDSPYLTIMLWTIMDNSFQTISLMFFFVHINWWLFFISHFSSLWTDTHWYIRFFGDWADWFILEIYQPSFIYAFSVVAGLYWIFWLFFLSCRN